jgi:hypothetical protein
MCPTLRPQRAQLRGKRNVGHELSFLRKQLLALHDKQQLLGMECDIEQRHDAA